MTYADRRKLLLLLVEMEECATTRKIHMVRRAFAEAARLIVEAERRREAQR
jgi:hypothetical protein